MFLSVDQVSKSLNSLEQIHPFFLITFLVCKQGQLPVGHQVEFSINKAETEFLEKYYKPVEASAFYYRVSRVGPKK